MLTFLKQLVCPKISVSTHLPKHSVLMSFQLIYPNIEYSCPFNSSTQTLSTASLSTHLPKHWSTNVLSTHLPKHWVQLPFQLIYPNIEYSFPFNSSTQTLSTAALSTHLPKHWVQLPFQLIYPNIEYSCPFNSSTQTLSTASLSTHLPKHWSTAALSTHLLKHWSTNVLSTHLPKHWVLLSFMSPNDALNIYHLESVQKNMNTGSKIQGFTGLHRPNDQKWLRILNRYNWQRRWEIYILMFM